MSTVDSRIVTMKFDNVAFERGVATTISTMGKLKSSLDLTGTAAKATTGLGGITGVLGKISGLNPFSRATSGAAELQTATSNITMGGLQGGITSVSASFVAMSTIAITALAQITSKALEAGGALVSSLTVAPISSGLNEYETNLNSIQTILANTQADGTGLKDVSAALDELNHYSDKTIYNFSEMARNIGTFTAAGVDLDTATGAIKGIANLAAASGSNSQQASTAMYQLSQAMAAGKVTLMDWNSVVNAGMGGEMFQKALMDTARTHGVAVDKMVEDSGSFRASLEQGWLSSDVLTDTLSKFTGDLTDAQLKQMGYTEAQIVEIQKMAKTAVDAATKVKTMSALIGTLQETAGSGWAKSWELIFGDFNEAKELFTGVNDVLGGMLGASADARNKVLEDWNKLNGRTVLIDAIANAWKALMHILMPIKRAFRDIFPAKTGQQLFDLTKSFREFTDGLIANKPVMKMIRTVFTTLFNVFGLGIDIVQALFGYLVVDLFKLFSDGSGDIISMTTSFFGLVNSFVSFLREGDKIGVFFDKLGEARAKVLGPIINTIIDLLGWFGKLAFDVGSQVGHVFNVLSGSSLSFLEKLKYAFDSVKGMIADAFLMKFDEIKAQLSEVADSVQTFLTNLFDMDSLISGSLGGLGDIFNISGATATAVAGIDSVKSALSFAGDGAGAAGEEISGFGGTLKAVGGFLIGVAAAIGSALAEFWGYVSEGWDFFGLSTGNTWENIKNVFSTIKDSIMGYLGNLGFDEGLALVNTGFFIALYLMFRSFVKKWGKLLESVTGTFDGITGVLGQVTKNLKTMQTDVRSDIILKIAAALALLAVSLYVLSKIDPKELANGLLAIAALLTMLVAALITLEETSSMSGALQLTLLGPALVGLGIGLLAMAAAVAVMGKLDPTEIQQGLIAIGTVLAALVAATAILGKTGGAASMILAAGALIILSVGLLAIVGAIKLFSAIDMDTLVNGGLKIAAILVGLALAMSFFNPSMILSAAGLFIVANALVILSGALMVLAGMGWEEMLKSVLMLASTLAIISGAMLLMSAGTAGTGAFLMVVAALWLLVPLLVTLGAMSWESIAKGLVALAGVFIVIGVGAAAMSAIVPLLYAFGSALLLLGAGLALVGAGMFLFATGLSILVASGAAGFVVLTGIIIGIAELFPLIMQQFGLGLIAFAKVIADAGPELLDAFSTLLQSLFQAIQDVLPEIGQTITVLIAEILKIIREAVPDMIATGWVILQAFLSGIKRNIGKVVNTVSDIIVKFLRTLNKNLPRIIKAGTTLMLTFLNGIKNNIGKIVNVVGAIVVKFISAMGNQTRNIIDAGVRTIKKFLVGMVNGMIDIALTVGKMITKFLKALSEEMIRIVNAGGRMLVKFLNGFADAIEKYTPQLQEAGKRIAMAILDGLTWGLASKAAGVAADLLEVAENAWGGVTDFLGVFSPSKKFIWLGQMIDEGFSEGIRKNAHLGIDATEGMGKGVMDTMKKSIKDAADYCTRGLEDIDAQPKIRPVLDLAQFQKDSNKMKDHFTNIKGRNPLMAVDYTAEQAQSISRDHWGNKDQNAQFGGGGGGGKDHFSGPKEVHFTQNNTSPKALSHVEIYRQTRNQLSMAREALKV